MEYNLFSSLRKYRPRESKDSLENYITEAFGWILRNYPDYSDFFLSKISNKMHFNEEIQNYKWKTQVNFDGFYPDMVCTFGKFAYVFENKAKSPLHDNQLENYRNYARRTFDQHKLILITAYTTQHCQDPDLAICWNEIYLWIKEWKDLKENKNNSDFFIFDSFLNLLDNEGMGPAAPISHESILYYYHARDLLPNYQTLINRLLQKRSSDLKDFFTSDDCTPVQRDDWGTMGIEFFTPWRPGIFIGILYDFGVDHCTKPIMRENSPDFSIILDFDVDLIQKYKNDIDYIALVEQLQEDIGTLENGWQFYNHLKDESANEINDHHPVHIRKPMLEVFRGTRNSEEQEKAFMDCAQEILPLFARSVFFQNLRNKLKTTY